MNSDTGAVALTDGSMRPDNEGENEYINAYVIFPDCQSCRRGDL